MINRLEFAKQRLFKGLPLTALTALVIALVSISLSAILIRFAESEMAPQAIAFNRFWITTVILGLWNGLWSIFSQSWANPSSHPTPSFVWILAALLALGVLITMDLVLWSWALTQTSVANATLLANFTPLFTTLGAWLIWGKRFDRYFLIGMVIAMGGAIAVGLTDWQIAADKLQGDGIALLAALSFSIYLLILEKLQTWLTVTTVVFWSSAIASVLTLPIVLITKQPLFPRTWQGWLIVLSLALVCQLLGQGFLTYSLKQVSSEFVALFLLLDPILAAIGAGILFSEHLSLVNWLAFAVVLVGVYLTTLSESITQAPLPLTNH
ncbi:DMT family transporter [Allocoleopsis franciscana]|uniref:Putative permease n=1 Tax=Allocoleopsis franciscana PCC 7113 TaxID=1173027 RepID=K9WM96_9CYAN|nr:DMT family transporter [Allocoleopsis franciscana]AFZ21308.1 putative permease [Allocoleopsis franciscana PCC 7113]